VRDFCNRHGFAPCIPQQFSMERIIGFNILGGSLSSITILFSSCWFSHQVAEVVLLQEHLGAAGLEVDPPEE